MQFFSAFGKPRIPSALKYVIGSQIPYRSMKPLTVVVSKPKRHPYTGIFLVYIEWTKPTDKILASIVKAKKAYNVI
jgi:hypothetical protein